MNDKAKLLVMAAAAVMAGLVAWTVFTVPPEPKETDAPSEPKNVEYHANTITEEKNGRRIWDIKADMSVTDVVTQATTFKNAEGHYYQENGTVITLTAPEGVYASDTNNIKLLGGVRATTTEGAELVSDALEWVASEDRLVATGRAKLTRPGVSAEADRIEAWAGFTAFRASGNAHLVKER